MVGDPVFPRDPLQVPPQDLLQCPLQVLHCHYHPYSKKIETQKCACYVLPPILYTVSLKFCLQGYPLFYFFQQRFASACLHHKRRSYTLIIHKFIDASKSKIQTNKQLYT